MSSAALDLIKRHVSRNLKKHKAICKVFGVDYEVEKAKQEAIWKAFQDKNVGVKEHKQQRRIISFWRALAKIDTCKKREKAIRRLEKIAKLAHRYATNKNIKMAPFERIKWARCEAYIYQVINSVMKSYDAVEIKQKLDELKKMIKNELGKKV